MLTTSSSVSGDTLLLTKEYGYKPIRACENDKIHVWNGITWGPAKVKLVAECQKVLTVVTDSGISIDVSPDEQIWLIQNTDAMVRKTTSELVTKDRLMLHTLQHVQHGNSVITSAYELGVNVGNSLKYCSIAGINTNDIDIPDSDHIMQIRLNWLSGLLDTNGHLTVIDDHVSIQVNMMDTEFLVRLKLLLQELGVHSVLHRLHTRQIYLMSEQSVWYLRIENNEIVKLQKLGLATKRLNVHTVTKNGHINTDFISVSNVIDSGKTKDLYSCIEPKLMMVMVNGVLVGCD